MRQFKLSKALAKKSETFRKLGEICEKFKTVAHKAHPQPIEFLPSKEFTPSESSKEAWKQIMKALKGKKKGGGICRERGGVCRVREAKERDMPFFLRYSWGRRLRNSNPSRCSELATSHQFQCCCWSDSALSCSRTPAALGNHEETRMVCL
ncbi:hypothetical protein NC651_009340 [Populus alba x Populus x berolinensis]|nr:hypothetical protein NC651_009340 [Populus alba x Populus x berolinensis]